MMDVGSASAPARIGPNAIIRVAESLQQEVGDEAMAGLFRKSGLETYLAKLPTEMVDEGEVTRLHGVLREDLGLATAERVAFAAGERTGDYLLANRIPRPVQWMLEILPAAVASRVLATAISRNAWTFAGSGIFGVNHEPGGVRLTITGCPVCRGARVPETACGYYAGTFERLFSRLVRKSARATEIACEASGSPACVFRVTW